MYGEYQLFPGCGEGHGSARPRNFPNSGLVGAAEFEFRCHLFAISWKKGILTVHETCPGLRIKHASVTI